MLVVARAVEGGVGSFSCWNFAVGPVAELSYPDGSVCLVADRSGGFLLPTLRDAALARRIVRRQVFDLTSCDFHCLELPSHARIPPPLILIF